MKKTNKDDKIQKEDELKEYNKKKSIDINKTIKLLQEKEDKMQHEVELPEFGKRKFDNIDEMIKLLQKKVDEKLCSFRQGPAGMRLLYMEGFKVIELANAIFGFNGWSMAITNLNVDFCDLDKGKYKVGVTVIIRITLKDGTYREDVGVGGSASADRCKALEISKKAAVTGGMKRAFRLFGNYIGNSLYDKFFIKTLDMDHFDKSKNTDAITYKGIRLIYDDDYDPDIDYSSSDFELEENDIKNKEKEEKKLINNNSKDIKKVESTLKKTNINNSNKTINNKKTIENIKKLNKNDDIKNNNKFIKANNNNNSIINNNINKNNKDKKFEELDDSLDDILEEI